jgi:hypothetical protein
MEIIQEIGSYAGFAAVLGLAVLSALYFSQARDVKRLREWAGRAPERAPVPTPAQTQRVVAQPIVRPQGAPAVPRPPGPRPATAAAQPAQAASTGAAPAVATGPAPATPAAQPPAEAPDVDKDDGDTGDDVTALDTVVHGPPTPDDSTADSAVDDGDGDGEDVEDRDKAEETAGGVVGEADEEAAEDSDRDEASVSETEPAGDETGEWSSEDEHSDFDFTEEHDAVAAPPPVPPRPPQPFPRRPGETPAARRGRGAILPPYAESRPTAEPERSGGGSRRPILLALAAVVALAVGVFAVLQVTGGDDSGGGQDAGLSANPSGSGAGDAGDGSAGSSEPIDPASVTVAVLNGTTEAGLAAQIGDQIAGEGFVRGVVTNNSDQTRAESVVLYAPDAEREAIDVSRRLDIPQREPIDPASQALAGDATVVVIAGADQIQ